MLRAVAGVSIIPRLWVSTLSQVLPVLLTATALALLPVEKMCDEVAESFSMEQNPFYSSAADIQKYNLKKSNAGEKTTDMQTHKLWLFTCTYQN
jgi:hypothetical protein